MSVEVSREGQLLVVRLQGAVSESDVHTVAHSISGGGAPQGAPRAMLAIVGPGIRRPDERAKLAMRSHRELLRSAGELHVVIEGRSMLAQLGFFAAKASRLLSSRRPPVQFYRDEAEARRVLRASGLAN
jgi:hypothetical protein